MTNEKDARKFAASKGLTVSKVRTIGARREITVGALTVFHDGKGGKGCWTVAGHETAPDNFGGQYEVHNFVGATIVRAVELQVAAPAA